MTLTLTLTLTPTLTLTLTLTLNLTWLTLSLSLSLTLTLTRRAVAPVPQQLLPVGWHGGRELPRLVHDRALECAEGPRRAPVHRLPRRVASLARGVGGGGRGRAVASLALARAVGRYLCEARSACLMNGNVA